jgi:hypothetical protein
MHDRQRSAPTTHSRTNTAADLNSSRGAHAHKSAAPHADAPTGPRRATDSDAHMKLRDGCLNVRSIHEPPRNSPVETSPVMIFGMALRSSRIADRGLLPMRSAEGAGSVAPWLRRAGMSRGGGSVLAAATASASTSPSGSSTPTGSSARPISISTRSCGASPGDSFIWNASLRTTRRRKAQPAHRLHEKHTSWPSPPMRLLDEPPLWTSSSARTTHRSCGDARSPTPNEHGRRWTAHCGDGAEMQLLALRGASVTGVGLTAEG